ncbi:RnfABCDGE type electron transport complex subunit D [Flavimaricola marinus]|uniref:Na(+)-translocating NADH-quinone reductase subunit B n=1 Tax=Flavimaricola marinus TaxID=1819565 RepID=A0A238LEG3_9RHOB|nr:RnfABCDGE type electron transport complex subunit D [Flavimaricola marinus]SMY07310.1 Na(+)-translocating NADH-quinone reductase subunit B [Flavimaricola marinus]
MSRGLWSRETVALMLIASCLPMTLSWLWFGGLLELAELSLTLLAVSMWHIVFMLLRAQPPSLSAVTTAIAIAMLAPEELGVFRMVLGISFGVVMGELVFGGWGRNVVNPATVTLSFLGFGFPSFVWPIFDEPVAWAVLPAALIGMATGAMPAAVVLGATIFGAIAFMWGGLSEPVIMVAGIVLVLVVADPVTSAATTLGRWINGGLYAALTTLFAVGWAGAAPVQIAVAAALLSSLAAPLLDETALAIWVGRRRRRHGRS